MNARNPLSRSDIRALSDVVLARKLWTLAVEPRFFSAMERWMLIMEAVKRLEENDG